MAFFARRFFLGGHAVGRQLFMRVVSPHPESAEILGVVGDVREFGLDATPEPTIYSLDISPDMDIVVKTASARKPLKTP